MSSELRALLSPSARILDAFEALTAELLPLLADVGTQEYRWKPQEYLLASALAEPHTELASFKAILRVSPRPDTAWKERTA